MTDRLSFHRRSSVFPNRDFSRVIKDPKTAEFRNNYLPIADFRKHAKRDSLYDGTQPEVDNLAKALMRYHSKVISLSLEDLLGADSSEELLECVYLILIYTMNNYIGVPSTTKTEPHTFSELIGKTFHQPSRTKNKCYERAKRIKPPHLLLNVKVVEATDLAPSDVDGLSDPYCKVKLNREKGQETTVQRRTLNPSWNERFCFRLHDSKEYVLHIEVWDKDKRGIAANIKDIGRIRGLRGFRIFCRECRKNICFCRGGTIDDFVGRVEFPVRGMYSEGFDDWVRLMDSRGDEVSEKLHISAHFDSVRPKRILESLKRHLMLLETCLRQALKGCNSRQDFSWEEVLSPSALTLVFQHRLQSGIFLAEDIICRFVVFVHEMRHRQVFDYKFLHYIFNEAYECMQQFLGKDVGLESSLEDLCRKTVDDIRKVVVSVISQLHSLDLTDLVARDEFESSLKCIRVCSDISSSEGQPWTSLKSEALVWFQKLAEDIKGVDHNLKTGFLAEKIGHIIRFNELADEVLGIVFPGTSYTRLTCDELDDTLMESVKSHACRISEDYTRSSARIEERGIGDDLNLFVKLKELNEFVCSSLGESHSRMKMAGFRDWFGSITIRGWFKYRQEMILPQIRQATRQDTLENVMVECNGRREKQSLSVKSTADVLQKEIVQLWYVVSHSKFPEHDLIFLEALHSCCMEYLEEVTDLVHSKDILANFKFRGRSKFCVIANDLWSLSIFVKKTVAETVTSVPPGCPATVFSLQMACKIVCQDVSREAEPDILRWIEKVIDAGSRRKQCQAISRYKDLISRLVSDNKADMCLEVFLLFWKETWDFVVDVVGFYKDARKRSDARRFCFWRPSVWEGLLSVLTATEKLCFIDDWGKLGRFMWTADFRVLKSELMQDLH